MNETSLLIVHEVSGPLMMFFFVWGLYELASWLDSRKGGNP